MSKRNSFSGTVPSSAIETPGSRFSLASIGSNELQATNAYCTNNFASASNENISIRKPPVGVLDPMMLQEMENRANEVASQVNLMLDQIRSHMGEFTELTLQTVNIYQEGTEIPKGSF
ncbi:hypothetical protein DSO57_1019367 [Entomophthora muscae]|uniref:Uncharacterized protein n=1 Tax=Entomophthora muscae TaxID=34485 RepID=A0ACC2U3F4_9FUNG|nr:hypothetical protein DSO57_1019367 [Entomophthora muscae]